MGDEGKEGSFHLLSPCYMSPTGLGALQVLPLLIDEVTKARK